MAAEVSTITPAACVAARKLLGWTRLDLARWALCSQATVQLFETGRHKSTLATKSAIRRAFDDAGVAFIKSPRGPWKVRLRDEMDASLAAPTD